MNNAIKVLLVLVVITLGAFSYLYYQQVSISPDESDKYQSLVLEGDKLFEAKEYSSAVKKYSEATDLIPTRSDSFNKIVDILILKKQLSLANQIIEKSSQSLSADDRAVLHLKLANAYLASEDFANAEGQYVNSLSLVEKDDAHLGLGKVYISQGNLDKAQEQLKKVSNNNYDLYAESRLLLSYLKLSDVNSAKDMIKDIDSALIKNKELATKVNDFVKVLNNLGEDELFRDTKLAREYTNNDYPFLTVKLLEPKADSMLEYYDGLYILARGYYGLSKYQSAIDVLSKALTISNSSDAYLLMARSTLLVKDQDKAFQYYDKAISIATSSTSIPIYKEYIELLLKNQLYIEAIRQLDKLSKVADLAWTSLTYADVYITQKNYPKALSYLELLSKRADLTDLEKKRLYSLKISYDIENNKLALAKEDLVVLKTLDRYYPNYYLLSGRVALIEGNLNEAKDYLNKSIEYDMNGETTSMAKKLLDRVK